ncbi:MAG: hypothetical protein GF310_07570 [candidate division Zixibacteria bacterium]|nr:hypothetical protein [candidate division Zixibacteria bacterium]
MPGKLSINEFARQIKEDAEFRKRLISRFSDTMVEIGVDPGEIQKVMPTLDVLDKIKESEEVGVVFIHKSDGDKNETSIVVGLSGFEKYDDLRLLREFEEFKAFKAMRKKFP